MRNGKPLMIIVLLMVFFLILIGIGYGALDNEVVELIDDLRMKHYGIGSFIYVPDNSNLLFKPTPKKPEYFFIIEDDPDWYDSSDYFIDGRLKILINGEIYWIRLER